MDLPIRTTRAAAAAQGPCGATVQVVANDPNHPNNREGPKDVSMRMRGPRLVAHVQCIRRDGTLRWEDDAVVQF